MYENGNEWKKHDIGIFPFNSILYRYWMNLKKKNTFGETNATYTILWYSFFILFVYIRCRLSRINPQIHLSRIVNVCVCGNQFYIRIGHRCYWETRFVRMGGCQCADVDSSLSIHFTFILRIFVGHIQSISCEVWLKHFNWNHLTAWIPTKEINFNKR